MPEECLEKSFSDTDSVEFLLSRPSGPGICSYALIAHLVYAHNEFVDMCINLMKGSVVGGWRQTHKW